MEEILILFSKNCKFSKYEMTMCSPTHSTSCHRYKPIDRSSKTAPVAAIPVNPYFSSNSAEYDVTLTSPTADQL